MENRNGSENTNNPKPSEKPNEALLHRHVDNERAVIVTDGYFRPLFEAWERHSALWDLPVDGLTKVMIRQGIAAASLHLANRPRDETTAWTINLQQPPTNLFLTGDARFDRVTGRIFTEGVRTVEISRLFIQAVRPGRDPAESTIQVHGLDILEIFEQYYRRSEQNPARLFELTDDRFLMILGLPGVDPSWIESLAEPDALAALAEARLLERRVFRFECGCSPQRMIEALRTIYAKDLEELFQGDAQVEVSCPRCGRRWWVRREQLQNRDQ
jgi:molecular chaperone Hsp33